MGARSWVWIRGLSRGQGHWGDFADRFRARHPEDDIEFLDLPGNGDRFRETSSLDLAAVARDLRERSRFVREGRRVHLFGHSLGGMVAGEWMRQFPEDLARLILMNTSDRATSGPTGRFNFANTENFVRILTVADAFEKERAMLAIVANNDERRRALLPRMAAYTAAHPVRRSNLIRQLLAGTRARFPDATSVPTLILGAEGDRLVAVGNTRALARRWSLEPHIHPTAGHDIPVDDPEWLLEQLGSE